jgi:hypothetical protein
LLGFGQWGTDWCAQAATVILAGETHKERGTGRGKNKYAGLSQILLLSSSCSAQLFRSSLDMSQTSPPTTAIYNKSIYILL